MWLIDVEADSIIQTFLSIKPLSDDASHIQRNELKKKGEYMINLNKIYGMQILMKRNSESKQCGTVTKTDV